MVYQNFYIKITLKKLFRYDRNGFSVPCNGYEVEVFNNSSEDVEIDVFTAAVGYELLENNIKEAEQFAKDYVTLQKKNAKVYSMNMNRGNNYDDYKGNLY